MLTEQVRKEVSLKAVQAPFQDKALLEVKVQVG